MPHHARCRASILRRTRPGLRAVAPPSPASTQVISRAHSARSSGETIVIVEDGTIEHGLQLDEVTPSRVSGSIVWSRGVDGEPRLAVHVLQAVPAQAMDATVESLTEAGAATIRPVLTHRPCRAPTRRGSFTASNAGAAIARESAQLAGRAAPPEVHSILPLREALAGAASGHSHPRVRDRPRRGTDHERRAAAAGGCRSGHRPRGWPRRRPTSARSPTPQRPTSTSVRGRCPAGLRGAVATSLLLAGAGDLDAAAAPRPA